MILISLVGEQPAPNLLPARRLRPDATVLVYTDRTESIAGNLEKLLAPHCRCLLCKVGAYNIPLIQETLAAFLTRECGDEPLIFNLTGGTKPMVLGAFRLAEQRGSPVVYFRTEGNQSCLYRYAVQGGEIVMEGIEELPETICLDDYLRLYLGDYETAPPREALEQATVDVLAATPELEVMSSVRPKGLGGLEVDFAVRYGNQVGIGEVKHKGAKKGIDQINAVAHPRYLGTYIGKFLVSARPVDQNNLDLADAYRIQVIELPSFLQNKSLDAADREALRQAVLRRLGGET
jgi:hypothetical protein